MMRTIYRSDDVKLRKSPSISATVYPVGYKMVGNDGNMWQIARDSRGVQRWQKIGFGGYDIPAVKTVKKEPKSKIEDLQDKEDREMDEFYSKLVPVEPKEDGIVTIKTKKAVSAMKMLVEDDPSMAEEIQTIVQDKLQSLRIFDDDPDVLKAISIYEDFLKESFAYGGKIKKIQKNQELYERALANTNSALDRELLEKKLQNLNEEKTFA